MIRNWSLQLAAALLVALASSYGLQVRTQPQEVVTELPSMPMLQAVVADEDPQFLSLHYLVKLRKEEEAEKAPMGLSLLYLRRFAAQEAKGTPRDHAPSEASPAVDSGPALPTVRLMDSRLQGRGLAGRAVGGLMTE